MKKFTLDNIDIFYSDEMERESELEEELDFRAIIDSTLDSFLKFNKKIGELAMLYSEKQGLERIAILSAHGDYDYEKRRWTYRDNEKDFSVQRWINKNDGKYGILILHCCNVLSKEIRSKKSAVIAYNYIYSGFRQANYEGQTEIYLPKKGYIDSYVIDNEIEKLKKEKK